MSFKAGFNLGASFTPAGGALTGVNGGGSTSKTGAGQITGWDWKESVDVLDVTHSATAGIQAVIAGVFRGEGNLKCNMDSAALLWATAGGAIIAGTKGVINLNANTPNTDWVIPIMIKEMHGKSEVAGKVELDFSIVIDELSGSYVRPT